MTSCDVDMWWLVVDVCANTCSTSHVGRRTPSNTGCITRALGPGTVPRSSLVGRSLQWCCDYSRRLRRRVREAVGNIVAAKSMMGVSRAISQPRSASSTSTRQRIMTHPVSVYSIHRRGAVLAQDSGHGRVGEERELAGLERERDRVLAKMYLASFATAYRDRRSDTASRLSRVPSPSAALATNSFWRLGGCSRSTCFPHEDPLILS